VKEKLLAAHRSGITTVVIPKDNRKDLREVPRRVLRSTRVVLVEHMDEVLREALVLPMPDALFGLPKERWEYRDGELVVIPAEPRGGVTPAPAPAAALPPKGSGGPPPEPAPLPQ